MILFDTYAWVEYFQGTTEGQVVNQYLQTEEIGTPFIVLIELSCKAKKESWDFHACLDFIKSKSVIFGVTEALIIDVGPIYVEARKKAPDFGLADAIVLTLARSNGAKILTGDVPHFRHFSDAILL